jgi:hypothetical protein
MKVVSCGVHLTTKVPADIRGTVVISDCAHDPNRLWILGERREQKFSTALCDI